MYDKLSNAEISSCVWRTVRATPRENVNAVCGKCVDNVMREALAMNTLDNITGIVIAFKNVGAEAAIMGERRQVERVVWHKPAGGESIAVSREKHLNYNSLQSVSPTVEPTAKYGTNSGPSEREKPPARGSVLEKVVLERLGRGAHPLGRNHALLMRESGAGRSLKSRSVASGRKPARNSPGLFPRVGELSRAVEHKALRSFEIKQQFPSIA